MSADQPNKQATLYKGTVHRIDPKGKRLLIKYQDGTCHSWTPKLVEYLHILRYVHEDHLGLEFELSETKNIKRGTVRGVDLRTWESSREVESMWNSWTTLDPEQKAEILDQSTFNELKARAAGGTSARRTNETEQGRSDVSGKLLGCMAKK